MLMISLIRSVKKHSWLRHMFVTLEMQNNEEATSKFGRSTLYARIPPITNGLNTVMNGSTTLTSKLFIEAMFPTPKKARTRKKINMKLRREFSTIFLS